MVALIPKEVVAFGAIPAARTDQAMVSIDINNTIAAGAEELCVKDRNPQPSLQHGFVMQGVAVPVESFGRDRVQPLSGPTSRGKTQVSLLGERDQLE